MDGKQRQTVRQVTKRLIAEDGWKGFYRGLGPRFFSMSAWGTTMIVTYEYLSRETLLFLLMIGYFLRYQFVISFIFISLWLLSMYQLPVLFRNPGFLLLLRFIF